eukprot:s345_g44.t1
MRSSEDENFRASELHPEDAKLRRWEFQSFQSFTVKTRSSEDGSFRASDRALPRRHEASEMLAVELCIPEDAKLRRHQLRSFQSLTLKTRRSSKDGSFRAFRASPRRRKAPKTGFSELSELHPEDAKLRRRELQSFRASP